MRLHHQNQRRRQTRGQLERRYALIAGGALAAVLCAGIWVLGAGMSPSGPARVPSAAVNDGNRTGALVHAASGRCRSFDNDTGRTVAADGACDRENEERIHGSAGRLDAIKKSFHSGK